MDNAKIAMIGDGGWGTALACVLAANGHAVRLWGNFPDVTEEIRRKRENTRFLPHIHIPDSVQATNDLAAAVQDSEIVVFSTPVLYLRSVGERVSPLLGSSARVGAAPGIVNVSKGIERETHMLGSAILRQVLGVEDVALLVGPSHAEEVARRLPTTIVAAARNESSARRIQAIFMNDRFRVYTSTDTVGVEIGAAVKNVIAIAAGICDGLGFGDNAKAALLTRGLAEITRLGMALGARRETFAGLSGLGDLITTCVSHYGRNLKVGQEIGRGKSVEQVLNEIAPMVPEGVWTTRAVCELAEQNAVEMPIAQAVRSVLFEGKPALAAAQDLMTRDPKPEI